MTRHLLCNDEPTDVLLLAKLERLTPAQRVLYMDFEGINLSRTGRICLGILTFPTSPTVYLLDFVTCDAILFISTPGGTSLASLLTSDAWRKVLFDPRSDVDALFHQYDVLPVNVLCLQHADIATRRKRGQYSKRCNGLADVVAACLQQHSDAEEAAAVLAVKDAGRRLFSPKLGGTFAVFEERPLPPAIIQYCITEVRYFALLERRLFDTLSAKWQRWVVAESTQRVADSVEPGFEAGSKANALAPTGKAK